jgi:uncharacterized protein YndB with AHSA1/START domain
MPTFSLSTRAPAPIEEVWKLLHDPSRFPEWWSGIGSVEPGEGGAYTMWPDGYPDFPMAQRLRTEHRDGRVTISCLVSDLEFCWQLAEDGTGTSISVEVAIPVAERHREQTQRLVIAESLDRLAALAAASC